MASSDKNSPTPGLATNAAWNCVGTLSDALIGFFMMPFVLNALGDTTYGLWALIASLTGCFGFLDLGVRGALGRQLAFHLARRDMHHVNTTLNTAVALLSAACLITLLGAVALQFLFFRLFDVSPDQEWIVRITLLLAGLNLALSFPISAFDATLWAAQRFDRLNQIDISVSVLKAVLMVLFLKSPATLICLPVISLAGSLIAGSLKLATTWTAFGGLKIGVRFISRTALGNIFGFGLWNFIGSLARQIIMRIPAVVIGSYVGPAAVTPYAIAEKLLNVISSLFSAATGVLTPKSAGYSALDDFTRQRTLFVHGGRLCWAMALFTGLGLCFFGQPFIAAWLGPKHPLAAVYLAIIALGSIVPLSQSMTGCVLLGVARHQFLAVIAIGQTVLAIGLSLLAATYGDALTVCVVLAVVSTLAGLVLVWHGCRSLHVPLVDYAREAVGPAVAACVIPAAFGAAMIFMGTSLFAYAFVAQMACYSLLFVAFFYRFSLIGASCRSPGHVPRVTQISDRHWLWSRRLGTRTELVPKDVLK
ncbi:MAG: oligosaccharide flippase family protein [Planctomycetota bacterium]